MTDTEIIIAIAEACGWQIHPKDRFIVIPPNSPHSVQPLSTIPSYTTDLNAMHEAEKVLSVKEELIRQCYLDNLCIATNGESAEMDGSYQEVWNMCHATASQRAEAFLRTIGKWKE